MQCCFLKYERAKGASRRVKPEKWRLSPQFRLLGNFPLTDSLPGYQILKMNAIYGRNCIISDDAQIGEGTRIGNFVFIRDNTVIGKGCVVGSYVDIEGDVHLGNFVALQSGCYLTRGVIIEDEAFCGPRVITMNDKSIVYRRPSLKFERHAPRILRAARIGGGSILCPAITIGENALVGAGSVVTRDVPDRAIVVGNPARIIGTVEIDHVI
jgi:acetyltransferase-like isoleucine patch superfamily enzyme